MTRPTDPLFDRRIADWLEDDPRRAPGRVLDDVLAALPSIPQRRAMRTPWDFHGTPMLLRLAAVAVIGALAVGGAFYVIQRGQPAVLGGPSPTSGLSASPSESASPSAVPTRSAAPSTLPVPSPTHRPPAVIAYIKDVYRTGALMGETSRVWIVGTDGTGAHELFPGGVGGQRDVAWSPDGTRLVYSEADKLYLTDASGSAPQLVDPGCVAPSCWDNSASFSPDGRQLVFLRASASTIVIATMDLATGRVVELGSTAYAALADERPRWSPDGKQIVFSRLDKFGNGSAVFVVDADGRNLRQLSPATLPARLPEWSPDGSRIVFTSWVNKIVRVGGDNVSDVYQDVYTVRPDWTDLRRLTTEGLSNGATWTPDGRIMFTRECTVQRPTGGPSSPDCSASGLWTMDADGNNAGLLVPGGNGLDGFPLITPGMIHAAWQPTP
jgi:dipeptidyl aminopeptidase/acylaminoacyl peptidase